MDKIYELILYREIKIKIFYEFASKVCTTALQKKICRYYNTRRKEFDTSIQLQYKYKTRGQNENNVLLVKNVAKNKILCI